MSAPPRFAPPLLALGLVVAVGCANLRRLGSDLDRLDTVATVRGEVTVRDWDGSPVVVVAILPPPAPGHPYRVERYQRMEAPGAFGFYLEPGEYYVGAFEDHDRDGELTDGERGVLLPEPLRVEAGARIEDVTLHVEEEWVRPPPEERAGYTLERSYVAGEVRPLSDDRFGIQLGRMGVWQPLTWLERAQAGVYMLQEYEEGKTPVVFVHGMSGYPQEFEAMIESLDRERFQPWVFLYPSGLRVRIVSQTLRLGINEVHIDHPFERLCLVGHSVGGLVARDYVGSAAELAQPQYARGLVTVATPFGGIPSAAKGVRMSPEVVPAWYDLVPDGTFIEHLFDRPLPEEIEFHLLMSYIPQQPSDGVVYISSQLRPEAQNEADVVRGYAVNHGGSVRSEDVIAQVNVALDLCRGDVPDRPRAARQRPGHGTTDGEEASPLLLPAPGRAP